MQPVIALPPRHSADVDPNIIVVATSSCLPGYGGGGGSDVRKGLYARHQLGPCTYRLDRHECKPNVRCMALLLQQ